MSDRTLDDEELVARVRAALGRGAGPSESVFAAIHAAAVQYAAQRQARRLRWRAVWHRSLAAAAAFVLVAAGLQVVVPQRSVSVTTSAATTNTAAAAAAASAAVELGVPADALALMVLVEGSAILLTEEMASDVLADYLLHLQEFPGGFETAHAQYAYY